MDKKPPRARNGTGTAREKTPGHWELRVANPLTGHQASKTHVAKATGKREIAREVDDALATFRAEVRAGLVTPRRGPKAEPKTELKSERTLGTLMDEWLANCERRGLSPTTLAGYRRTARSVQADLVAAIPIRALEPHDLDAYYGRLTAGGMKPRTLKNYACGVSSALGQARKWRWVFENVAEIATLPDVPKPDIHPPSVEELGILVTTIYKRSVELAFLALFAFLTGCRRGELCGLRWEDVDWDAHTLRIARSVWQLGSKTGLGPTKGKRARTITLDDLAMVLLEERWDRAMERALRARVPLLTDPQTGAITLPSQWYVWASRIDGGAYRTPNGVTIGFSDACKELNAAAVAAAIDHKFKYRFHDLRHMCATQMIAMGIDMVTGSERLGHSVPSTFSNMYGHSLSENAQRAAVGLGELGRTILAQAAATGAQE